MEMDQDFYLPSVWHSDPVTGEALQAVLIAGTDITKCHTDKIANR
jgi:hypothetical protein